MDDIAVVEYDPGWPVRAAEECARLWTALGLVAGAIEHIGSTAVPGLAAKPVIDLMVGARVPPPGFASRALQEIGYESLGEHGIADRHYFRKGRPRTVHIHWVDRDSPFWRSHLAFRDALRGDPGLARRYAAVKRSLAARFPSDREGYSAGKGGFISAILR